ncbi:MAG: hypothetical protein Fur0012_08110 [Elusimicrobiota bacterium]
MISLRYNLIVLVQVFLNFINSVFLIREFGVSPETDAYFILLTVFSSIYLIQLMPIEQFMYFYNDAKLENRKFVEDFYFLGLFTSSLIGFLSLIVFVFGEKYLIKFFVYKMDSHRLELLISYSKYYKYILLVMPINYIFSSTLIAESKIGYSYISNVLPPLFTFISLFFSFFVNIEITFVIKLTVLGYFFSFAIYVYILKHYLNYDFKFNALHRYSFEFIKNSFMMRFGHNINNFGLPFFTNNFLSFFQTGYVSHFYYAQRIALALQNIMIGPSSKVLQSKISSNVARKSFSLISYDIKKYFKFFSPFVLFITVFVYFLIPSILGYISSGISYSDTVSIQSMFAFMIFLNFIMFFESPFDMFLIAQKNSRIFMGVNFIFILIYLTVFFTFLNKLGVYSVLLALVFSQSVSAVIYFLTANRKINFLKIKSGIF